MIQYLFLYTTVIQSILLAAINPQEVLRRKAWEEKNYKYTKSIWPKDLSTKVKDTKTGRYDDDDIINHLTYPVNRLPPSHAKKCDAR